MVQNSYLTFDKRRKPQSPRAISTFDAILQATKEVVEKEGLVALNTNRIAEHAGVSIGSLYQYFPNREAILFTLYEEIVSNVSNTLKRKMFEVVSDDVQTAVPALLELVLSSYESNEVTLIHLVEEVPNLRKMSQSLSIENLIHSASRVFITQYNDSLSLKEVEIGVYFVASTILSHMHKYLLEKPEHISRAMYLEELSKMVIYYFENSLKKY